MKQLLTLGVFIFIALAGRGEVLDIGIYRNDNVKVAIITPSKGSYEVFGDGKLITEIYPNDGIRIFAADNKVGLRSMNKEYGKFDKVMFVRKSWGNHFRFRPVSPEKKEGKYNDNLLVTAKTGVLKLINKVYLEHYVGGVVEAESGSQQNAEYYKLQSIVCRTYALNNYRRHEAEGFNLCDQVHCQVYHGMSRFCAIIPEAVNATKGLVIVDSDINLITAAFHSNCGGQTINSEDVWSKPLPYLKSVPDSFCVNGKHAYWEKQIPQDNWLSYLKKKHAYPVHDVQKLDSATRYSQGSREVYYADNFSGVPLEDLRTDWNLKSTYFSVEPAEGAILLKGRGFGHGVGMCQEGAMRMSQVGFTYNDIVHFYYTGVHIIDLSVLNFFKEY
jgi:stage II sporulation protein D